jgi:DNA-binding response OmpR family regulator
MRLLVVEDDLQIAAALGNGLRRAGYAVDHVADGVSAIEALTVEKFDLVILDLGLPKKDGSDVLREMRRDRRHVPVIVVTARDEPGDRIQGLDLGADDYVVKPFELGEIEARIRAVLRRAVAKSGGDIEVGGLRLDMAAKRVTICGSAVELSPREYCVLEVLVTRAGRVVSKAQIQQHLCGWSEELNDSAIELYIHRVRKKIEGANIDLRTARGFGYVLVAKTESK